MLSCVQHKSRSLILIFRTFFLLDISKLVPLSFVADTVDYESFEPESSGLLIHEYFDKIYKLYPNIKSYKQLQKEEILHVDPLKEKLNPYSKENSHLGNFKAYLESMSESEEDKKRKASQKNDKFKLDADELKEYLRPTIPPFSAINEPKDETEDKEKNNEEDEDDEEDEDIPDFIKDL